jgi:hypothetical protein
MGGLRDPLLYGVLWLFVDFVEDPAGVVGLVFRNFGIDGFPDEASGVLRAEGNGAEKNEGASKQFQEIF